MMTETRKNSHALKPIFREIWIVPHQYSCGGYWMADRFPEGREFHFKGGVYTDDLSFMLLSGRMEVLSKFQVEQRLGFCRERGEIITEVWADSLPEGSRLQL